MTPPGDTLATSRSPWTPSSRSIAGAGGCMGKGSRAERTARFSGWSAKVAARPCPFHGETVSAPDRLKSDVGVRYFGNTTVLGIALLAFAGCATTLREVQSESPALTTTTLRPPAAFLACVRDHMEEHHGGFWGTQASTLFEVSPDVNGPGLHLIGRSNMAPSDVRFVITAAPGASDASAVTLRMSSVTISWPQLAAESAAREAVLLANLRSTALSERLARSASVGTEVEGSQAF